MTNKIPTAISGTDFTFEGQLKAYHGKVRDVYFFEDRLAVVATDRISAFDHILPRPIPFKGQVLNKIAAYMLESTADIVPNWLESVPHPNVSIGKKCESIRLEMVVRGHLAGHAWRQYKAGHRMLCGVTMPDGMKESEAFNFPIITPATKADEGHDEDISAADIIKREIVDANTWKTLCNYSLELFYKGQEMARESGLILVDTKYEFGIYDGQVILIDEIHTPDSSRYYYLEGYEERQKAGEPQKQLSKEFVREWLMDNGFHGHDGDKMPIMDDSFLIEVSDRYIELYEKLTNKSFERNDNNSLLADIEKAVLASL